MAFLDLLAQAGCEPSRCQVQHKNHLAEPSPDGRNLRSNELLLV